MNSVDNAVMYKFIREAHCPNPRCLARYRPAAMYGAGKWLAKSAKLKGLPLTHLRDFVMVGRTKPTRKAL